MRLPAWWRGISPRRRLLVTAIALLAAAGVVAGVVAAVRGDAPGSGRPSQDQPGPVLLVPGYGGAQAALARLAERIHQVTGRPAEVLTLPGDGTGDLLDQVAVLDDAAERAHARGAPSVDVIGYSAGGVVAAWWVTRDGGAHQARRVVTLGAPLHGTQLAATATVLDPAACPTACRQLAPGSSLLQQLQNQPVPEDLPWLSVWTERDEVVVPPDSARLTGAVNVPLQQACPGNQATHSDLPTDPQVTALVLRALGTAPLSAPATCG
ncbi:lipase family alpha/beta hydrolase [Amycolatopsis thermophila]|uniref:Triacylglycerol esterase/lipase EstA (Alpha/beta hydrolase family) n=1 Tax=Amycolatopsis thermophila TaxID=206084 RepID=A0ABU0F4S3_9PSEU|nr:alpha/beta hydrolase [Amycolatopsis thermophila]MDQ0382579.1 triacylglycerol esterase/lipase EstA (alpha/beta hydrolase family) [Amycolatopsis thermophila]